MYDVAKELMRDAFMEGALDLGRDDKFLEGFIRLFAGEMEALIAIEHAFYLTEEEAKRLIPLARPNKTSLAALQSWKDRINA
ncbi:MAG: hypothetical protein AAGF55_01010 [Pseudomonadota bacterium]